MSKIAYIIGAGASFGTLPMVSEIEVELNQFIKLIKNKILVYQAPSFGIPAEKLQFGSQNITLLECCNILLNDVQILSDEIGKAASIDTLAKRLQIRNDFKKLNDLKNIFTLFFNFLQASKHPSPRHDSFFASILKTSRSLPKNIRILSWNYDSQFEMAYKGYFPTGKIMPEDIRTALDMKVPQFSIFPWNECFRLIKLNGSAEFGTVQKQFSEESFKSIDITTNTDNFDDWVKIYMDAKYNQIKSNISFAWDHGIRSNFFENIKEDLKDVESFVIIGYSFPYFNKDIDTMIFESSINLKKIYIQDPQWKDIEERINSIPDMKNRNIIIKGIENLGQFFMPNEL